MARAQLFLVSIKKKQAMRIKRRNNCMQNTFRSFRFIHDSFDSRFSPRWENSDFYEATTEKKIWQKGMQSCEKAHTAKHEQIEIFLVHFVNKFSLTNSFTRDDSRNFCVFFLRARKNIQKSKRKRGEKIWGNIYRKVARH